MFDVLLSQARGWYARDRLKPPAGEEEKKKRRGESGDDVDCRSRLPPVFICTFYDDVLGRLSTLPCIPKIIVAAEEEKEGKERKVLMVIDRRRIRRPPSSCCG